MLHKSWLCCYLFVTDDYEVVFSFLFRFSCDDYELAYDNDDNDDDDDCNIVSDDDDDHHDDQLSFPEPVVDRKQGFQPKSGNLRASPGVSCRVFCQTN